MAVLINSTNPAAMPSNNPTRYNHVVCSHLSSPNPMSQPTAVAAGKMNANWLYRANCTQKLSLSRELGGEDKLGPSPVWQP